MANHRVLQAELARLDFLVRNEQQRKQQQYILLKEIRDLERAIAPKTSGAPKGPPTRSIQTPKNPPNPNTAPKIQSSTVQTQKIPDVTVLRQIKDLEQEIAKRKSRIPSGTAQLPAKPAPRPTRWLNPGLQTPSPGPAHGKRRLNAAALLVSPSQRLRQSRHRQYVRPGSGEPVPAAVPTTVPTTAPAAPTSCPAPGPGNRSLVLAGETYLSSRRQLVRVQAPGSPVQRTARSRNMSLNKTLNKSLRKKEYCLFYNKLGKCNRGEACRYVHDPRRVTICLRYLRGECSGCLLRHQVEREQMPHCMHFLHGLCTRPDCPYLHVGLPRDADLCPQFLQGRCPRGRSCTQLHSFLCPEWRKTGACSLPSCRLVHRRPQEKRPAPEPSTPPAKRLRAGKQIRPRFRFDEPPGQPQEPQLSDVDKNTS